jgi:ketosteroid isomerase-like protein
VAALILRNGRPLDGGCLRRQFRRGALHVGGRRVGSARSRSSYDQPHGSAEKLPAPAAAQQETEMSQTAHTEMIWKLFAAYMANDRKAVEDAFTDDFRFTTPYDDAIDKATYFERCWRVSDWIERQQLEKILVEGDEAFVTYRCVARDGKDFRNTEFFVFKDDRIKRIDVYFGAAYENGVFVSQPR